MIFHAYSHIIRIDGRTSNLELRFFLVVSRVMCEIVHAQILKEWKVMAYFPYRV
jgi:hypothetical protein